MTIQLSAHTMLDEMMMDRRIKFCSPQNNLLGFTLQHEEEKIMSEMSFWGTFNFKDSVKTENGHLKSSPA